MTTFSVDEVLEMIRMALLNKRAGVSSLPTCTDTTTNLSVTGDVFKTEQGGRRVIQRHAGTYFRRAFRLDLLDGFSIERRVFVYRPRYRWSQTTYYYGELDFNESSGGDTHRQWNFCVDNQKYRVAGNGLVDLYDAMIEDDDIMGALSLATIPTEGDLALNAFTGRMVYNPSLNEYAVFDAPSTTPHAIVFPHGTFRCISTHAGSVDVILASRFAGDPVLVCSGNHRLGLDSVRLFEPGVDRVKDIWNELKRICPVNPVAVVERLYDCAMSIELSRANNVMVTLCQEVLKQAKQEEVPPTQDPVPVSDRIDGLAKHLKTFWSCMPRRGKSNAVSEILRKLHVMIQMVEAQGRIVEDMGIRDNLLPIQVDQLVDLAKAARAFVDGSVIPVLKAWNDEHEEEPVMYAEPFRDLTETVDGLREVLGGWKPNN